jgi:hypothetical protein
MGTTSPEYSAGPVPGALLMKLAVNTFLIGTVAALAEAFHFAEGHGLDPLPGPSGRPTPRSVRSTPKTSP